MCNELYIYRNGLQTIQMLIRSAVVDVAIRVAVLSACLHIWNWIFSPASIDSGAYYMQ